MSEDRRTERGTGKSRLVMIVILVALVYTLSAVLFASDRDTGAKERIAKRTIAENSLSQARGTTTTAAASSATALDANEAPGRAIYSEACSACHTAGAANAPKRGDKAAWEPRLTQGIDRLLQAAIDGKGAMPPRGTCRDCTDDDLKLAIEYMLGVETTRWRVVEK